MVRLGKLLPLMYYAWSCEREYLNGTQTDEVINILPRRLILDLIPLFISHIKHVEDRGGVSAQRRTLSYNAIRFGASSRRAGSRLARAHTLRVVRR